MKTITKEFKFEASHQLGIKGCTQEENEQIFGKCANLHGHTYKIFITITSVQESNGMILNYSILKDIFNENVYNIFDHHHINDLPCMKGKLTTAENIIDVIWNLLTVNIRKVGCQLEEIKLYETATSCCTLTREKND